MLQAHIDNSGWDGQSPAFVMAGYVASEGQWEAFSQDWQAVLDIDIPNKLRCLKMAQAYRLKDPKSEFFGWTEKQRDDRLIEFVKTITKHAAHGIVSVIPNEPYLRLFKGKFQPTALDRPYFLSFFAVLARLYTLARQIGEDRLELYFDVEGGESEALLNDQYELCMSIAPPEIQALGGGLPIFKHDHELKPLQAADMIAWHARRYYYDLLRGFDPATQPSHVFLANLFLPKHDIIEVWTEEKLREVHDALANSMRRLKAQAEGVPMTFPDPASSLNWRF